MQPVAPPQEVLGTVLAGLMDLSRRARNALSLAELGFLLVNDSLQLAPYRQAALWQSDGGVTALSGLVQVESNTPYVQWLATLSRHLHGAAAAGGRTQGPRAFDSSDMPADIARDWGDWWPAHALWLPMPAEGLPRTALLLVRDHAWSSTEVTLLAEWTATWWHALQALRHSRGRSTWLPWQSDTAGALGTGRPWWRRPALLVSAAMLALCLVPVRLSVLAPGELVPRNPAVVRSPLDGVVGTFHVQPNQQVHKGQPLFGFDEALLQSRLHVANQALATAGTEYRQAMQQALTDPRVRPQLTVLGGRIQEKRAESGYLREQLARAQVLAPQDGIVLFDDPAEWIGKPVTVGERILRIAATSDVEVEAWLPIGDAIALAPGARVSLYLLANPLEPVGASLRYIAHEASPRPDGSFAYRVRATPDSASTQRPGLKGTAKLQGDRVPLVYWVLRRPIATLRATLGV